MSYQCITGNIVLHMEDSQLENQLYLLIISMQDIMLKNIINIFKTIKGRQLINILDKASEHPGLQVALLTSFMKTLKMMYHSIFKNLHTLIF